jgi:hypothetical protein
METKENNSMTYLETIDHVVSQIIKNGRAINKLGGCSYYVNEHKMCAVGLCLINPEEFELETKNNDDDSSDINTVYRHLTDDDDFFKLYFKEEFQHLNNIKFWINLQNFHDRSLFWINDNTLSKAGKEELNRLKLMYAEK